MSDQPGTEAAGSSDAARPGGDGASLLGAASVGVAVGTAPRHSLAAVLRLRSFRRLWIGLALSSLGDWLGLLALTALASQLVSGSYAKENFAIAGVLFMRVLPAVLIGPLAGYVADRLDRRWTLIVGDVLRFVIFASIPIVNELTWLYIATVLIEVVSLVWLPAKDATVPNLVPRERLEAANQLSLATTYGSALPAAGIFIVLTLSTKGLSSAFGWSESVPVLLALYFNAFSFLLSGLAIWTIRGIPPGSSVATADQSTLWSTIVDGWAYVHRTPLVRGLVVGIVGAFAAGGVVIGLARVYVEDLGAGDPGYGVLFGSVFLGLAMGMWLGPRMLSGLSRRRLFGLALTLAGFLLAAIAIIQNIVVVAILVLSLGFCAGIAWITGYTLLGLEVEDALRGRTFAFVNTLIRLALALVLAIAPLLAGLIGVHTYRINDDAELSYNGAAFTFLIAAVLATIVGLSAYRQMDDRRGVPLTKDLKRALVGRSGDYAERGVFIALEGGEGAGKSTQAGLLSSWLREQGYDVVLTHEPGDSAVGAKLRAILLDPTTGSLSHRAEALLYAADKAEHIERMISPALARGAVVITDRYVDSTLAYQGAGRDLLPNEVERVARWATHDLRPHLTVLLDLPPSDGRQRLEGRRLRDVDFESLSSSQDRLEAEPLAFHERVRSAFLRLAATDSDHYAVLDARLPPGVLAEQIQRRLVPLLERAAGVHRAGEVVT
ncbi:MAG: dTMP kinase [Nocardioidaceae bacterium]